MPNNAMKQTERAVHVLDAKDMILGRLATQAADLLRGKNKVSFEQHQDCGDYVTIINAAAIKVTGNKLEDKIYYSHSGYIGNLKEVQLKTVLANRPEKVIEHAISGMLPKNRLRAGWMRRLKVYAGEAK
jgi:large subunit ribosomal protein L13